ncbi:MAG: hypothetical protein PHN22_04375 [Candidatus ainarchaeum sp.]|nr:hypothetical protein [Candidatus ainarchaeum sp.]
MNKLKEKLKKTQIGNLARIIIGKLKIKNSKTYWENLYLNNGNSGSGSYGKLAQFKADIINDFIKNEKITEMLEFGCGDGNQLKMFKIKKYIGLDVSETIIKKCIDKYKNDKNKSFFIYNPFCFSDKINKLSTELTVSLDVLYHLLEYDTFQKYLTDLFKTSKKYVIIYSSNYDDIQIAHEKRRNFTSWIEQNIADFKLIKIINNKYPYDPNNPDYTSLSDFYIYKKIKK